MPRTLVTGATGFIGSHVVRLLVQRGDDVVVTVRPSSRLQGLKELDVRTVRADILDRRSIRRAMQGVERLFHIAGDNDLNASRARTFQVNVEGMTIVLEEALRARVQRAVYTSSVAAIGPAAAGKVADEATVWEAGRYAIAYLDAKHQAETAALRLVARGLPLVIVNPAHTLGAGDPGRSSTALVRRFMRRQIPAYVDGTLNIVGVEDVARGHLLADERGAVGERYILGNRNFTMDRLFADLGRLSGIEPPAVKLPLPAALALAEAGRHLPGPEPAHAGRGQGGLAALGLHQPQGQARARLDDLTARGLPGGDDRLVSPARPDPGPIRGAPAARPAPGRRGVASGGPVAPAAYRLGGRGHAVSLQHSHRLAVPVRQGRAGAAPRGDPIRGRGGAPAPRPAARGRGPERSAAGPAAGARRGGDLRLAADHGAPGVPPGRGRCCQCRRRRGCDRQSVGLAQHLENDSQEEEGTRRDPQLGASPGGSGDSTCGA